jgi:hypothetical protein
MTADLGSPLGHASPCTLASLDVPTCSSILGHWPWLSPLLGCSLPVLKKIFSSFPEHSRPFSISMTLGLFSHWLSSLVHPANENRAPFSTDLLYPIYTLVFRLTGYSACHLLTCWFLLKLIPLPWRWRRYVPPKRRLQLNGLHGVTSQMMILFITTTVKTSNPTWSRLSDHTASLSKLLIPSPNALVIRWSDTILMSKFTLNSNNGFMFCIPQHGLCFLWYWSCTCNQSRCPLTIVGMHAQLVSVKLFEFTITLQVPASSCLFSFMNCRCLKSW